MRWSWPRKDPHEWHRWFAWYPVRVTGRRFVWLEWVERRTYEVSWDTVTEIRDMKGGTDVA